MEQSTLKAIFNKYYTNKENIEIVIQKLRDGGASQMECTKTLKRELGTPLREADEIVVNSKTWADIKNSVEKLRDDMFSAIQKAYPDDASTN